MNLLDQINTIEHALQNTSHRLPESIYEIYGLTSSTTQTFLNLICTESSVLEVGTFCGASTFAMGFNNKSKILTIDNWSGSETVPINNNYHNEIVDPKETFLRILKDTSNIKYIEGDIFSREIYNKLISNRFDIIYYDGSHEVEDIIRFVLLYSPLLENAIVIFDDWNFESVRVGLSEAISELNIDYKYRKEIITNGESKDTFWNGLGIFIF